MSDTQPGGSSASPWRRRGLLLVVGTAVLLAAAALRLRSREETPDRLYFPLPGVGGADLMPLKTLLGGSVSAGPGGTLIPVEAAFTGFQRDSRGATGVLSRAVCFRLRPMESRSPAKEWLRALFGTTVPRIPYRCDWSAPLLRDGRWWGVLERMDEEEAAAAETGFTTMVGR